MADPGPETELVTVRNFESPFEAHLARTKLESEGIDAVVADEHLGHVDRLYSIAAGGVRVLVRAEDAERADAALSIAGKPERETRCPVCGSPDVRYGTAPRSIVVTVVLILLTLVIGYVVLAMLSRRWVCNYCDHTWRHDDASEGD